MKGGCRPLFPHVRRRAQARLFGANPDPPATRGVCTMGSARARLIFHCEAGSERAMRAFCIELPRLRRVLVAVLLVHLLAVMAMAASPGLHEWVHDGANESGHDCAVVLFMTGGAEQAVVVILVVAVLVTSGSQAVLRGEWVEGIFRVLRILEHAPPAAS